jgi:hypothetical protein
MMMMMMMMIIFRDVAQRVVNNTKPKHKKYLTQYGYSTRKEDVDD